MDIHHQPVGVGKGEHADLPDAREVEHHPGDLLFRNAEPDAPEVRAFDRERPAFEFVVRRCPVEIEEHAVRAGEPALGVRRRTAQVDHHPGVRIPDPVPDVLHGGGRIGRLRPGRRRPRRPAGGLPGRGLVLRGAARRRRRIQDGGRHPGLGGARRALPEPFEGAPRRGLVVETAGVEAYVFIERLRDPAARRVPADQESEGVGGPHRKAPVVETLGGIPVDPALVVERVVAIAASGKGEDHRPVLPRDGLPPVLVAHRRLGTAERLLGPPRRLVELFRAGADGAAFRAGGAGAGQRRAGAQQRGQRRGAASGRCDHRNLTRAVRPGRRAAGRRGPGPRRPGVRVRPRCGAPAGSRGPFRSGASTWRPSVPG